MGKQLNKETRMQVNRKKKQHLYKDTTSQETNSSSLSGNLSAYKKVARNMNHFYKGPRKHGKHGSRYKEAKVRMIQENLGINIQENKSTNK